MSEHNIEAKDKDKLIDPKAALASIKKAQAKGNWPVVSEEKQYPTPEEQKQVLDSIPAEHSQDTIPPEIKKELTDEAKKLNTMAMASSGENAETETLPHTKPFVETPTPPPVPARAREEGVKSFKNILREQEEVQKIKNLTPEEQERAMYKKQSQIDGSSVKLSQDEPLDRTKYEGKAPVSPTPPKAPMPEDALRADYNAKPQEAPKQGFLEKIKSFFKKP